MQATITIKRHIALVGCTTLLITTTPLWSQTDHRHRQQYLVNTTEQVTPEPVRDNSTESAPAQLNSQTEALPIATDSKSHLYNPLQFHDIVAYYGHPLNPYMGILGETPPETMLLGLQALSEEYDALNGNRGIVGALHIIYATATPEGDVVILGQQTLERYIKFAEKHALLIILDHQIGRHSMVDAVRDMLPYLQFDHVHLAIDPEWATTIPGQELGSVSGEEINHAQQLMEEYLIRETLPGQRLLVVHQFNWVMISNPEAISNEFEHVVVVHNADGFGPPEEKIKAWNVLRTIDSLPIKGIKMFYPKEWRNWGSDVPLFTPTEALALSPRPVLFMYQ